MDTTGTGAGAGAGWEEGNDRASMAAEMERRRRVVESRLGTSLAGIESARKKEDKSIVWSTERHDHDEAARKLAALEMNMPGPAGQKLALVNKTHVGRRPASSSAGFRILGFFADVEEASGWIQGVPGLLDAVTGVSQIGDIYAVPLRRWTLLAETIEREEEEERARTTLGHGGPVQQQGGGNTSSKIESMLAAHVEHRKTVSADFEARLYHQPASSPSPAAAAAAAAAAATPSLHPEGDEKEESHAQAQAQARTWRGADQVPAQGKLQEHTYAAVVILEDSDKIGGKEEPALMILGAWGSEEEATEYIKTTAALWIIDHDVHVVDSYVWHWPSASLRPSSSSAVKKTYRDDELSLLVESARKASEVARMAEESARAAGKTLSVIEIGGEGGEGGGELVPAPGETSVWPEVDRQLAARSGCTGELVAAAAAATSGKEGEDQ